MLWKKQQQQDYLESQSDRVLNTSGVLGVLPLIVRSLTCGGTVLPGSVLRWG